MAGHGDDQVCTGLVFQLGGQLSISKVDAALAAVVVLDHALFQAGSVKALAGRSDLVASHGDDQVCTGLILQQGGQLCISKVDATLAAVVVLDDAVFQAGSLKALAGSGDVVASLGDTQVGAGLIFHFDGALSVSKVSAAVATVIELDHTLFQARSSKALAGNGDIVTSHGDDQVQTGLILHLDGALSVSKVDAAVAAVVELHETIFQARSIKAFAGEDDVVSSEVAFGLTTTLADSQFDTSSIDPLMAECIDIVVSIALKTTIDGANVEIKTISSAGGSDLDQTPLTLMCFNLSFLSICSEASQGQNHSHAQHDAENLLQIFHSLPPYKFLCIGRGIEIQIDYSRVNLVLQ